MRIDLQKEVHFELGMCPQQKLKMAGPRTIRSTEALALNSCSSLQLTKLTNPGAGEEMTFFIPSKGDDAGVPGSSVLLRAACGSAVISRRRVQCPRMGGDTHWGRDLGGRRRGTRESKGGAKQLFYLKSN